MKEVRNLDGRKICTIDPEAKIVVIVNKGVETSIELNNIHKLVRILCLYVCAYGKIILVLHNFIIRS